MKKFTALLLALLMAFTMIGTAFATQSPSIKTLYNWTPPYEWTELAQQPTMADLEFAAPMIEAFLGSEYEMFDAFQLDVAYRYAIVHYEAPYFTVDGDFMIILTNEVNTYYFTPIIIEETAVMDFTNVEPAVYTVYVVHSDSVPE